MHLGRLAELRATIERAATLVDDADDRASMNVGTPGRYLADPAIGDVIERIAAHDGAITLIVGAGASMEAELPSWPRLVRRLLESTIPNEVRDSGAEEWMDAVEEEGLLAAAAVVKSLTRDEEAFSDRLREALYGGRNPASYRPQALAQQIAWLKHRLGAELRVVTANYDGLLEQAMRDRGLRVHSYVRARAEPAGSAAVYHLHGRLVPSYPSTGRLVLAEDDYARVQWTGSWQDKFMRAALEDTLCVFVGLSLTDPNIIRWLYRYSDDARHSFQHVALFTRQGSPPRSAAVRRGLEHATVKRWRRCGVQPVWADFFWRERPVHP